MNDRQDQNSTPDLNHIKLKPTWQDKLIAFFRQMRRFGWDLLGTFLLLIVILSLLGLLGISHGLLLNPLTTLLKQSMGWGSYLFLLTLGYLGVACFLFSAGKKTGFRFVRLVAIECAFFNFLGMLTIFGGVALDRAEKGLDGGRIGWGLANIFWPAIPLFLVGFLFTILTIGFLLIGFGWVRPIYHWLLAWSESTSVKKPIPATEPKREMKISTQENVPDPLQSSPSRPISRDDSLPPLNLLLQDYNNVPDEKQIRANAKTIERTLSEFGIPVRVIGFRVGPTVTQYALEPGFIEKPGPDGQPMRQKVRVSQISALTRDLTLALRASRLRIETPVPGRSYVGIEVPNTNSEIVRLRSILESSEFKKLSSPLSLAIGRNVSGEPVVADLAKMPHLLIAGTTNSGKSVCITAITACLVMNNKPSDLKLVMLDPKMVELVRYNGMPHLLGKVETELERMLAVLRWALVEMDSRYRILETAHSRDLGDYNQKMLRKKQPTLPHIVILIDELADLMMSASDQTERCLIRLAQMARATGIHLVVATQRPSTDVVTGLIKANFPARISFLVASSVDSRVILDSNGAESLLGKGDLLLVDPQKSAMQRAQGVMVSDQEIEKVLNHWQKMSQSEPEVAPWEVMIEESSSDEVSDDLIEQAIAVVKTAGKASNSLLMRRLRVGYPRAARLLDELEEQGIIGPAVGSGKDRELLVSNDDQEFEDEN
ncbi:MAG: DNA translocase FtsK [Anaerolineaceae bacterium]